MQQKQTLFLQTQHLHIPSDHTTRKSPPGAHTWPFLFALPPHLPESVDWLPANTFITYGLTATVSTGHFSRPQTATERLRLVKTPSFHVPADDYDVSFAPAERELLWPDALIAQVTLAQPLQPTDGALALDFRLLPLGDLAGAVRLGAVKLELVQTLQLVVSRNGAPFRTTRKTRSVASSAASVDELVAAQRAKGGGDEDDDGGGRVCFSVKLPLPGPPYACVQTVDDEGMKVRYALRVGLEVGGAEGEMCEVRIVGAVFVSCGAEADQFDTSGPSCFIRNCSFPFGQNMRAQDRAVPTWILRCLRTVRRCQACPATENTCLIPSIAKNEAVGYPKTFCVRLV